MKRQIVIIGGGIGGLSAAWALRRRTTADITLLERETLACAHASAHNAAIFRPLEESPELARLALESRALFAVLRPEAPLVDDSGLLLLSARQQALQTTLETAQAVGADCRPVTPDEVQDCLPGLALQQRYHGLFSASGGVIDIHALAASLLSACRAAGVSIRTGSEVAELTVEQGRVRGVRLANGDSLLASEVVVAAGAWSGSFATRAGCELGLTPVRRHLAVLDVRPRLDERVPAVWRLGDEVYFRREGQRVLASPCDETAYHAGPAQPDLQKLGPLADKLRSFDPQLAEAKVVRHWACLRTFASDRRPVIGADPRLAGLFWLAALGGFGMSTGLAAGEWLAGAMHGERIPRAVSVERLL